MMRSGLELRSAFFKSSRVESFCSCTEPENRLGHNRMPPQTRRALCLAYLALNDAYLDSYQGSEHATENRNNVNVDTQIKLEVILSLQPEQRYEPKLLRFSLIWLS